MFIDLRERERERERETPTSCLPYAPQQGIEPATQACDLAGNVTHNILVYGMAHQSTGPHWPGYFQALFLKI